jgi:hypothetical protein
VRALPGTATLAASLALRWQPTVVRASPPLPSSAVVVPMLQYYGYTNKVSDGRGRHGMPAGWQALWCCSSCMSFVPGPCISMLSPPCFCRTDAPRIELVYLCCIARLGRPPTALERFY